VIKVESVAGDKYAFDFGGGSAETIAVNGTDQAGIAGTTVSVIAEGPGENECWVHDLADFGLDKWNIRW